MPAADRQETETGVVETRNDIAMPAFRFAIRAASS